MNRKLFERLTRLEEQAEESEFGYRFYRVTRGEDGPDRYELLASGKTYSADEFAALVGQNEDLVYLPLYDAEDDPDRDAYWSVRELESGSWQDLLIENAGGPMAPRPGRFELPAETDEAKAELVAGAKRYAARLEAAEPIWEEMRTRAKRIDRPSRRTS